MTQTQIAKALRLRTPTISHHMKTLRMASLANRSMANDDPSDTRFAIRAGRVDDLCASIKDFLEYE